jgi:tetratricopeptide (TPR) repeat protein
MRDYTMTRSSAPVFFPWRTAAGLCLCFFLICSNLHGQQADQGSPSLAASYRETGKAHYALGEYQTALRMHKMSQGLLEKQPAPDPESLAETYHMIGLTYTRLGIFDRAEVYLEKSLTQLSKVHGTLYPGMSVIYGDLGDLSVLQSKLDKALAHYQQGIVNAFADFRYSDPEALPDLAKHRLLIPAPDFLKLLHAKARLYQLRFERTGQTANLEAAFTTYMAGDKLLDQAGLQAPAPDRVLSFYESALQAVYTWFEKEPSANSLQQVYWLMEKGRRMAFKNVESLPDVVRALNKAGMGMIEFFAGEKAIYAFVLTDYHSPLIRIPLDFPLEAGQLYEKLWQRLPGGLPERLVILPSGALCNIPFEAISTGAGKWLVEEYSFSYAFSASEWLRAQQAGRGKAKKGLLGVAPLFPNSEAFSPMAGSRKEVSGMLDIMGNGDLLLGAEADSAHFQQEAPQYRFLHLSTYAAGCDSAFLLPWIALSGAPSRLFSSDIEALRLEAEMAVLSYSENGPEVCPGPSGLLNLSRAFAAAGCPSTLFTLWKPDEEASEAILTSFYQNLKEGMPKDLALRQAKIAWLGTHRSDPAKSSPAYWAPLLLTGSPAPIEHKPSNPLLWLVAGALGLVLGRIWWKREQKRRMMRKIGRL